MGLITKQRATVGKYEGTPTYTADNGKSFTRKELLSMPMDAVKAMFSKISQAAEAEMDNIAAGFVEVNGLFVRPANIAWNENTHNLITTNGYNTIASRMGDVAEDSAPLNPNGIRVGLSNATPQLTDTNVATATTVDTTNDYIAFETKTVSTNTITWAVTWDAGQVTTTSEANGIREAVLVSAKTATDAVSRITFTAVDKDANDSLTVQFKWTFAAG